MLALGCGSLRRRGKGGQGGGLVVVVVGRGSGGTRRYDHTLVLVLYDPKQSSIYVFLLSCYINLRVIDVVVGRLSNSTIYSVTLDL